mmetsp:Transcript_48501/g.134475  ORF Transcript_48501/g.134475 Transcript_48501/m.134475 type:complete len:1928 (+) Transcript_48501:54-5837(+)
MLIIAAWFAVMAHPTTDTFEPVSAAGELYDVPKHLSREFARSVGINEDQNFPRAMDPANEQYNWCEDWQPLHNVRWLEKVNNGAAVEWIVIWGNSKGAKPTMQRFYQTALAKWNDLPPWNTFRLALPVDAKRTMKGFRVSKLPLAQSRERLCRKELPLSLRAKAASLAPATQTPQPATQMPQPAHTCMPPAAPLAPAAQSPMPAAQMGMYGAFNFAPIGAGAPAAQLAMPATHNGAPPAFRDAQTAPLTPAVQTPQSAAHNCAPRAFGYTQAAPLTPVTQILQPAAPGGAIPTFPMPMMTDAEEEVGKCLEDLFFGRTDGHSVDATFFEDVGVASPAALSPSCLPASPSVPPLSPAALVIAAAALIPSAPPPPAAPPHPAAPLPAVPPLPPAVPQSPPPIVSPPTAPPNAPVSGQSLTGALNDGELELLNDDVSPDADMPPPADQPRKGADPSATAHTITADDGYESDTSTSRSRTRRPAYLIADASDGFARRLAFGEYDEVEGLYFVPPGGILEEGVCVDVGGLPLGSFDTSGGMLSVDDLDMADLDFDFDDDLDSKWEEVEATLEQLSAETLEQPSAEDDGFTGVLEDESMVDGAVHAPGESDEVRLWRERCREAEDEAQYLRDSLVQAQGMAYADMAATFDGAERARCLVEVADPTDKRKRREISLEEWLRDSAQKGQRPPTLTTTQRVREAEQKCGAYKQVYAGYSSDVRERANAQLASKDEAHRHELEQLQQRHREELQRRDEQHAFAIRFQQRSLTGQAAAELQRTQRKHQCELAARTSRAATWCAKRSHMARALQRAKAGRASERLRADTNAAELQTMDAETTALHAERGESFKVAAQRQSAGSRAVFTFQTIHRDLMTRQCSLNSGAANVRSITKEYSEHIAADGRSLNLESGSLSTVLRWEKRVDVLCMLQEGRALRNAIRTTPETKLWFYMDLSPDCRAIEQFGAGFEYATVEYLRTEAEAPPPFTDERLSGAPLTSNALVGFGPDGCPITTETVHRTFTPMLEAIGPKYSATIDCFLRTLQLYGLTPPQLIDDDFAFATIEQADIPIPLLDHIEGFVSDAGGEVHKSGGVISVVLPRAMWRHCGDHGLNLSLEKSASYREVGSSVRSIASFCRNGNKHKTLVLHMKRIQQPELAGDDCDPRYRAMYRAAHEHLRTRGHFHTALDACEPADLEAAVESLALVTDATLERKYEKGNDTRWKFEAETLDKKLLDTAHLLAPAILIMYGDGTTYGELKIDPEKNKSALTTWETLNDPKFLFWATYMRVIFTSVYKGAFNAVQFNHHRNAPALAGPDGLPLQWAAALRKGVVPPKSAKGKPTLAKLEPLCAPLVAVLTHHPSLGGLKGECASAAAEDLLAQAEHITSYFARWNTLEGLVHVLAREEIFHGPLPPASCERLKEWGVPLADAMPRSPTPAALEAAREGIAQFAALSEEERCELQGSLPWLLFSPKTREGATTPVKTNPVFDQVKAFAAGSINPATGHAYPYRCWHGLTQVLVAGGCLTTSAQCESLFTGLTRQQGASKLHMSQQQIAFEARCRKNPTMESLSVPMLSNGWAEAKAVQHVLDAKGFWSCDVCLAANRSLAKKRKEELEIVSGATDEPAVQTYDVEHIVRVERKVKGKERTYVVKWVGWESKDNTIEPESHLLVCKALLSFWKGQKNTTELLRVTKLQEAALQEREEASRRRTQPLQDGVEHAPTAAVAATAGASAAVRPAGVPALCKEAYDRAHSRLGEACCLIFDTETSGFGGCVLNLGWILATAEGVELAAYERLWQLPSRERIHSQAFKAHGISKERLSREGVDPKLELAEFFALVAAALAAGVVVAAHYVSFDVRHLNHTAHVQKLPPSLRSASMLCTMHSATKHCGLRKRGNKALKAPRNEELYTFLFKCKPTGQLHSALPDCRVTLASFVEGRKRKWW